MASITKREGRPSPWQVRYKTPDGQSRRRQFRRKVDAERFAATVEADKVRGEWTDPALGRTTFAEGPTDEALQAAATVYRLAHACGEPPTKAVEDRFGLTRSTAGRYVAKARERGLLKQTTPGKAAAGGLD